MRLSDIPQYHDVINHFAEVLVTQDQARTAAHEPHRDQPQTTSGVRVGFCQVNDIELGELLQIPIYLDQDKFNVNYPLDMTTIPLADLVAVQDETELRIVINQKTYITYLKDDFVGVADAAIAMALSHYCLSTMEPLGLELDADITNVAAPLTRAQAIKLVHQQLDGVAQSGDDYNCKIGRFAASFNGITPIIALMTTYAYHAHLLVTRMHFNNLTARLLVSSDQEDDLTNTRYTDFLIELHSPDQVLELARRVDGDRSEA